MSKNKLSVGIAFILTALALLPTANAQILGLSIGNMLYILTNALIIGVALFLIQSVIVQDKNSKEKAAVWTIIAVVSLILAYNYGYSDFIWRTGPVASFFNIHIIGNTLIIGSVFYLLIGLLDRGGKLMQSTSAKIAFGIMLFLMALFIAVKLGPNTWVWEAQSMSRFIRFLFDPNYGILNPDGGLYIFVSSFILFVFFFNGFLLPKGAGNSQIVNWILAFLFSSTMASYGASMDWVIVLGQIFLGFVLYKAISENFKAKWWISLPLTLLLIGFATFAITSGMSAVGGTRYGGIEKVLFGAGEIGFGWLGGLASFGWSLIWRIGGFILLLVIVIFAFNKLWPGGTP